MINLVQLEKKTVNWREDPFPEDNPFEVKVQSFESGEDIQLYNYRYQCKGVTSPKAVIMIFHGFGSYTGKYGYYAKYFADQGYEVVGFDFRGFGKTEGQSGHLGTWKQHLSDCWKYYDIVRKEYDEKIPFIGCGYSLGGGTTYSMAIERPNAFRALIQLAPYVDFATGSHPAYHTAKQIYKFYPRLEICPPLRNPAPHMCHYYNDPLQVSAGITAGSLMTLFECKDFILENYKSIKTDMHITVGDCENIVSRAALQSLTLEAEAEVKEYHEYPGVNHYLLNDGIWMEDIINGQLKFLEKILQ